MEEEEQERQALEDIEQYGCHILHVLGEDDLPPFSYSIGIEHSSEAPELIVIGLKHEVAHEIINDYNIRVQKGEAFEDGKFYSDFLEGFEVKMIDVDPKHYKEYLGWGLWLYKGDTFKVLQLVYPDSSGAWPWDESVSDSFKKWQPLLQG